MRRIAVYSILCAISIPGINNARVKDVMTVTKDSNVVVEVTVNLMQNCFNRKDSHIVLSGNWSRSNQVLLKQLSDSLIPLKIMGFNSNNASKKNPLDRKHIRLPTDTVEDCNDQPANNFIIVVSSNTTLVNILKRIRNSVSWNHEGFFLIINEKTDCYDTSQAFLRSVWAFNILSAVVLCGNSENMLKFSTFNPYAELAPPHWTTMHSESKDAMNFYEYSLKVPSNSDGFNESVCEAFTEFEKTENLNGYTIRIGLASVPTFSIDNLTVENDEYHATSVLQGLSQLMWNRLNATPEVASYEKICFVKEKDRICRMFDDLKIGRIDYIMNMVFQHEVWKYTTYPSIPNGLCVVASMDKRNIFEKMAFIITPQALLMELIACLATIIIFKYLLNISAISAGMEFTRMLLSFPSLRQPAYALRRLTFAVFIFLTMTLNLDFQSRMSAAYIAPDADPTIDSLADLEKSSLHLHGMADFKEFMRHSDVYNRYVKSDNFTECVELVKEGRKFACLFPCALSFLVNETEATHVSKHPLRELYQILQVRRDWPLTKRVDGLIQKALEFGLIQFFINRELYYLGKIVPRKEESFVLSAKQLYAAFGTLIFGTVPAILVFLTEMLTYKRRLKQSKRKRTNKLNNLAILKVQSRK